MTWGAYIVGMVSSLFSYLYLRCAHPELSYRLPLTVLVVADTHPAYNAQGQYTAPVVLLAFLIGIQCCACTFLGVEPILRLIPTYSVDSVVCDRSWCFYYVRWNDYNEFSLC